MDIGMLWFDNDRQADLSVKVERAVFYYQEKYGQKPNLCFVNPSMVVGNGNGNGNGNEKAKEQKVAITTHGVEIRESVTMLPNHFWIGIQREES